MFDLEQGTTSLLSFQQAIGGSLSRSARVTQDMDEDDKALECSSGSVVITVPALNEIVVDAKGIRDASVRTLLCFGVDAFLIPLLWSSASIDPIQRRLGSSILKNIQLRESFGRI